MQILPHKLSTLDGEYYELYLSSPKDPSQKRDPSQPVILCMPAMGVPARKYLPLAESLNQRGCISAIFELRGIGSSSVRASRKNNFGYHHILSLDLPEAIAFIRQQYPNNPIYLLGHSLGGQLALLYMSINPDEISGLIGIATGSPYHKAWRFPYNAGIIVLSKLMPLMASILGYFPGRKFGFAGRESKQLVKDWAHSVLTGNYIATGHVDDFEMKIKALVKTALIITIKDDFLAPQASSKNLGEKLTKSQVIYHHLDETDYDSKLLGHFNWMKAPEPVTQRVNLWISERK